LQLAAIEPTPRVASLPAYAFINTQTVTNV
jgi:hypothetical protein